MNLYLITPERSAMLNTINWAEGSPAYNQAFNYIVFNNYGPHPNLHIPFGDTYTTAAGRYQFLWQTWQDAIKALGLPDYMSPENQDQAALWLIDKKRGVLDNVDAGDVRGAVQKLSWEWASLPVVFTETVNGKTYYAGSGRYGQPTKTIDQIITFFNEELKKKVGT